MNSSRIINSLKTIPSLTSLQNSKIKPENILIWEPSLIKLITWTNRVTMNLIMNSRLRVTMYLSYRRSTNNITGKLFTRIIPNWNRVIFKGRFLINYLRETQLQSIQEQLWAVWITQLIGNSKLLEESQCLRSEQLSLRNRKPMPLHLLIFRRWIMIRIP